ncbi:hypothetical protein [Ruminococcus sp.]|uniref:hypothetical protein n=1 Tax=Ruminococcus sp. TaxID=41978 RepID=UPI00399548B5
MKNRSLARFVVFALIQVVLCVLAFVFAAVISSAEPEFQTDGSIYVDGTDFTPLAQLGARLNGVYAAGARASFLVTAVISAVYCCRSDLLLFERTVFSPALKRAVL